MKKILSVLLVLSMLLSASAALAEGMGVQVIGGPETETEPVSLDDVKLNTDIEIEGFGKLIFTSYDVWNRLGTYRSGQTGFRYSNGPADEEIYSSGKEAEFILVSVDIVNTCKTAQDFLSECEVKVVYDEEYEFGGWYYQRNYNNAISGSNIVNDGDKNAQNVRWVIKPGDQFAIDPMYEGHYVFGCTLPNAVIESKAPLKMIITIGGNELTYNIRK